MKYLLLVMTIALTMPAAAQQYKDPGFPGGTDSLVQFINNNINIPEKGDYTEEGTIAQARLVVDRKGKISFISTVPTGLTDPFSRALVNMIKKMPDWEPGLVKGKKTFTQYVVTGKFYLQPQPGREPLRTFMLDMPPHFPGGDMAAAEFINSKLRYPRQAVEQGVGGQVVISMLISETGELSNFRVISQPIGYGLEEEAMEMIKAMPNWEPAIKNGEKVAVEHTFPVTYTVTNGR
ncbi:energy transducer TonB [Chitinophaga lutea]|nr:energy transducer TonB [Chitinophaga lutea]